MLLTIILRKGSARVSTPGFQSQGTLSVLTRIHKLSDVKGSKKAPVNVELFCLLASNRQDRDYFNKQEKQKQEKRKNKD